MDVTTPEFIRWSLGYACEPRLAARGEEPEQVERQLKALRAYGEAIAERRVLDGVCFEAALNAPPGPPGPPSGFRVSDVFRAYGVETDADVPCPNCPAHIDRQPRAPALAGCYGLVDWSAVANALPQVLSDVVEQLAMRDQLREAFLPTQPVWYGFWADSPLKPSQVAVLEAVIDRLVAEGNAWREVFERLLSALRVARASQLPVFVAYSPAGVLSGRHWTVAPHCSRCKAGRPLESRVCDCCGLDACPLPARRRLRRGTRPYRPLAEFLGPPARNDLLRRYLVGRGWSEPRIEACLSGETVASAPHTGRNTPPG